MATNSTITPVVTLTPEDKVFTIQQFANMPEDKLTDSQMESWRAQWVNLAPPAVRYIIDRGFDVQNDFENETHFAISFLTSGAVRQAKYLANDICVKYQGLITAATKANLDMSRTQGEVHILKMESAKKMKAKADAGTKLTADFKSLK